MNIPYFHVDAFTQNRFSGNAAGVCLLSSPLSDQVLRQMAQEHHLAETAFVTVDESQLQLRWFTPELEMDLCGHATLAAAHVLFSEGRAQRWLKEQGVQLEDQICFSTVSGVISVYTHPSMGMSSSYTLDLPERAPTQLSEWGDDPQVTQIIKALGQNPIEVWRSRDVLCLFEDAERVRSLNPDPLLMGAVELGTGGVIVTASGLHEQRRHSSGRRADFISRFFTPQAELFEDDVTGSAHCTLGPFWSQRLNVDDLVAYQASERGGWLTVRVFNAAHNDGPIRGRVWVSGEAVTYMEGTLRV